MRPKASVIASFLASMLMAGAAVTAPAAADDAAILGWARQNGHPLRTVEAGRDTRDLRSLLPMVDGARVVAIGEPAHGAHEPLAFRNRVIRYLVEERQITAVALETGFTEARAVSDYVEGGPGEARTLVREHFSWGFGGYRENVELIEWLRAYNAGPQPNVRFYGMDLSGADDDGGFPDSRIALDVVTSYLARMDGDGSRDVRAAIAPFAARFSERQYPSLTSAEDSSCARAIEGLADYLRSHRASLAASSSASELEWVARNLAIARALQSMFRLGPPGSGADLRPDDWRRVNVRDGAMAANVEWILEREGPSGRLLVFAHNSHVMTTTLRGGIWSAFSQAPTMMGQRLRQSLGHSLRVIGTLGGSDGEGLPQARRPDEAIETVLHEVGEPLLLLDLRNSPLQRIRPVRANFTSQMNLAPASAFDVIVYFDHLSAARTSSP